MDVYRLHTPHGRRVPILLSVPHCGTAFPPDIAQEYDQDLIQKPDDTDWFVDQLYRFAPTLGATMISAVYHRWVIDLNRDPESKPLYSDGRIITGLCPVTTFLGKPLYADGRTALSPDEIGRRKRRFFYPFHSKLQELLADLKTEFGTVLLWDCHSIRQWVPTISKNRFPDLILGSAEGASAGKTLVQKAIEALSADSYSVAHNRPFKGGYITRTYGKPAIHEHALQLEMSKINYMDDQELEFHPERAAALEQLLRSTLSAIADTLISGKVH